MLPAGGQEPFLTLVPASVGPQGDARSVETEFRGKLFKFRQRMLKLPCLMPTAIRIRPHRPDPGFVVRHHLPSYGQRRSIGISFLFFSFVHQSQIVILSGRQLRGFHQHALDMFVALCGKWCAYYPDNVIADPSRRRLFRADHRPR